MSTHLTLTLSNTAATRITPNGSHSGMDITIQNPNMAGYIYIGGDDTVTSTNFGYRIAADNAISFELPGNDALYAIASNVDMKLAVMQVGLESQL